MTATDAAPAPPPSAPSTNGAITAGPTRDAGTEHSRAALIRSTAKALAGGRAQAGGRHSIDGGNSASLSTLSRAVILPPMDYNQEWRWGQLDTNTLDRVNPARLVEMLLDMSPEMSRGAFDWLRLFNPGWTVKAIKEGGDTEDPKGQKAIDEAIRQLGEYHGSPDVIINRLALGAWARGAFCAEGILDLAATKLVDLAAPDPASIRFKSFKDPVRGQIWVPGQWNAGKFVVLDQPTFRYVPVDPLPGNPYGRPLCSPAIFVSVFLLVLLHDLKRVVQQQGYPRLDFSIDLEQLMLAMPEDVKGDPSGEKQEEWIAGVVTDVQESIARLQPDDNYVHTSVVVVGKQSVGTVDASSLGAVDGLIKGLERMIARALKVMPLLIGITEGASEANANRQWEVQAAGIKAFQHLCESLLGHIFGVGLRAAGISARVVWEFAELRASEELRDEQTRRLRNFNNGFEYDRGWVGQDEAAEDAVGHPADQEEPRVQTGAGGSNPLAGKDGENPEPGSGRGTSTALARRRAVIVASRVTPGGYAAYAAARSTGPAERFTVRGADDPLDDLPAVVEFTEADITDVLDDWDNAMPGYVGMLDAEVVNGI